MKSFIPNTKATLTDFEQRGLSSLTLADGHAYHDLEEVCANAVTDLPMLWRNAARASIPDMEVKFRDAFADLIQSVALARHPHFRICPTASNSIDIVGACLVARGLARDVVLVEPTFDNLALLMRRRGVQIRAVPEASVCRAVQCEGSLDRLAGLTALFLVNPNNPTGAEMTREALEVAIDLCKGNGAVLIIDASFRLYNRGAFDDYESLAKSGVSFIVIEDTGKVWPTLDLKASLLVYSADLAPTVREVYNELYLCVSKFSLELMSYLCRHTAEVGIPQAVWRLVDSHRKLLRSVIANTHLYVGHDAAASGLSVEWLSCAGIGQDIEVVEDLDRLGLSILPGRQFFWASHTEQRRQEFIRLSLARPTGVFLESMTVLKEYLRSVGERPLISGAKLELC